MKPRHQNHRAPNQSGKSADLVSLNIVFLEDNEADSKLVLATLKSEGLECHLTRTETREEFIAALERGGVDVILSDFNLPGFSGAAALELVKKDWPEIPIILVSGTVGEETAIESLKQGATDYVLKERLGRLGPAVRRAVQDVSRRGREKQLEAQFIEAQKMEVVGQLAGGVAHDFNNILAVIMGYSDLLGLEMEPDHPLIKYVDEIRLASQRAAGLTRQLLVFSRNQTVQPTVLDVAAVVKSLDQMMRRLIDENIEMSVITGDAVGNILGDAGYVSQLVMNLVVNARDAMPEGGRVTISTRNEAVAGPSSDYPPGITAGNFVVLSVSDTGTGMTDEVKRRLFEPFFTTKPAGKGTGLGLSTCHTIVQQSNAFIGLESELGKGTTFKIYFPRVDEPVQAHNEITPTGPLPRGTETLLIVEDDPSVRQLARGVLEAQGYQVIVASNGQDALHEAQQFRGERIHLTITDVVMPLMGGKVMAEWLQATFPEMTILFTSGYTDETISHHGVLDDGVHFLAKPYTPGTLARKVREVLDASAPQEN